jgi:hypothetical protein
MLADIDPSALTADGLSRLEFLRQTATAVRSSLFALESCHSSTPPLHVHSIMSLTLCTHRLPLVLQVGLVSGGFAAFRIGAAVSVLGFPSVPELKGPHEQVGVK